MKPEIQDPNCEGPMFHTVGLELFSMGIRRPLNGF